MWVQGQLKGNDMFIRDPGEKGEQISKAVSTYCQKGLVSIKFDGEFNDAIFIFLHFILWSKNEFENFTYGHFRRFWMIWKPFFDRLTWNLAYT